MYQSQIVVLLPHRELFINILMTWHALPHATVGHKKRDGSLVQGSVASCEGKSVRKSLGFRSSQIAVTDCRLIHI